MNHQQLATAWAAMGGGRSANCYQTVRKAIGAPPDCHLVWRWRADCRIALWLSEVPSPHRESLAALDAYLRQLVAKTAKEKLAKAQAEYDAVLEMQWGEKP